MAKLDTVLVSHPLRVAQLHSLRTARDEYLSLQRAVSEAKVQLLEEKKNREDIQLMNDRIERKQRLDQAKVRELIEGAKPVPDVKQNVELKQGKRPSKRAMTAEVVTKFEGNPKQPQNDLSLRGNTSKQDRFDRLVEKNPEDRVKTVFKTVVIPKQIEEDRTSSNLAWAARAATDSVSPGNAAERSGRGGRAARAGREAGGVRQHPAR